MIDFKKKLSNTNVENTINPVEIYKTLDRKTVAGPLRPAQEDILNDWYEKYRNQKDLIIKLHTGEGKTLIGLLILQSVINQKEGPCLYICPNKYLVDQVIIEAKKFGIPYCTFSDDNDIPEDFSSGDKILITNAHKVFNGKTVFGIGNRCVNIGAVVMDDAHACSEIIKDAFAISIFKDENAELYGQILTLFSDELIKQGEGSFLEIQEGMNNTFMLVPYWSWFDKSSEIIRLLVNNSSNDRIKFVWPLIKDNIKNTCCYISGNKVEIVSYSPNVRLFGSFSNAKKRILMSATTQNDSFFIKGLSFDHEAVKNPLIYNKNKWSGEKMILLPSLINERCDRNYVISSFCEFDHPQYGVCAIVPSMKSAEQYRNQGAIVANANSIGEEIKKIKNGELAKLFVLVNRFDGIDLPDECCRILLIDSMPYFDCLSELYEWQCRPSSEIINKKLAQKIEQGMGRAVRGEKDYCAILIIGPDIVKFVRSKATNKYFSSQTRKQIMIGIDIAKMAQEEQSQSDNILEPIKDLIRQLIDRNEGWKEYYHSNMDNRIIVDESECNLYDKLAKEHYIEDLFEKNEIQKACDEMQVLIDAISDDLEQGWYLQQLARYKYHISKTDSIKTQQSAFKKNSQLLKPKDGIIYKKVSYINENRLNRIRSYIGNFEDYNEFSLHILEVLGNLSFGSAAEKFESALKEIGELIGFISQRPDHEFGRGPDNLWCCGANNYMMFECKDEVEDTRDAITKSEAGQMNNHFAWFEENYGQDVKLTSFMIIVTKDLSASANFSNDVNIIRKNKLRDLKDNLMSFIKEFTKYDIHEISDDLLYNWLSLHKLNAQDFEKNYSEPYYHKNK